VAQRGIEDAFSRGATLYAVGQSAAMLGAYTVEDNQYIEGFSWLAHALVMPHYMPEHAERLRARVQGVENGYGLGLSQGAALALGPRGEVEVWGNAQITVSLGQSFDTSS